MSHRGPGFIVRQQFSADELRAEEWRIIPHEGLVRYFVSSLGRVRSQWIDQKRSQEWRWPTLRAAAGTNYLTFKIKHKNRAVHVLVLETFVGARPEGMEAAHLNGIRIDARLINLAWVSAVENQAHKKEHGTQPRGGLHYAAKLNEVSVREIRAALARGELQCDIADRYGVCGPAISYIKTGKAWKHVA